MTERYVRPPLVAREPAPAWRSTWLFRVGMLLVLVALVTATVLLIRALTSDAVQDPGLGALARRG